MTKGSVRCLRDFASRVVLVSVLAAACFYFGAQAESGLVKSQIESRMIKIKTCTKLGVFM